MSVKNKVPDIRFKRFSGEWTRLTLGDLGTVAMNKRIFRHQTTTSGEVPFFKIGTFGKQPDAFISKTLFDEYKKNIHTQLREIFCCQHQEVLGVLLNTKGKSNTFKTQILFG